MHLQNNKVVMKQSYLRNEYALKKMAQVFLSLTVWSGSLECHDGHVTKYLWDFNQKLVYFVC